MNPTPAQSSAIHALNPELLVSAAAGSGKTAVLVERIYTLIREHGYSLDRMLVCTFTHAAAAEMRERLEVRLSQAALTDKAMRQQADLVETAQISTLHSFCQKIVREHFEAVNIDPQASLCDEAIRQQLKNAAMEQCLDEACELALTPEGAAQQALLDRLTQNEILEALNTLHAFLMAKPEPFAWLDQCARHMYTEQDLEAGPMAEALLQECRLLLDGALALWEDARALAESPYCQEGYKKNLAEDGILLNTLNAAAEKSLAALIAEAGTLSFGKLATYRLSDPAEIDLREQFKALRERYKKFIKEEMAKRLPSDPVRALEDLNAMQPALLGLSQMTFRMHTIFMELKEERGLIDFSDLEHMALQILSVPELQKKLSSRFDAVFVDEYQDISAIQEAILNGLRRGKSAEASTSLKGAKPGLRFYVGDVKQSIYRFRQADPSLFMAKLRGFSPEENAPCRKISLNQNFRSRESVLKAVNQAFSHVMRAAVTQLDYDDDARLNPGIPSQGDDLPELHVLDGTRWKGDDRLTAQAQIVVDEIRRRVGRPKYKKDGQEDGLWSYRDMVVLMPVVRGIASIVEKTLTEAGIPVYFEDRQGSMESPEIHQTLAHLRLLDNQMDDPALLTVLRGPVYAMTEAELAQIRMCRPEKEASFHGALVTCAQRAEGLPLSARCQDILETLDRERFLQRSMALDEYLWGFLSRSGLYGFYGAQPGGRLRQANLRMLCSKAGDILHSRSGSLGDFLAAVAGAKDRADMGSPSILSPWEDVVRVMTIHKSKGLEFPLVFVMGLGRAIHMPQRSGTMAMDHHLGIALTYVNPQAGTKRGTLLGSAIAMRQRAAEKAEAARVLYVALTRAQDQLIALGIGNADLFNAPMRKTGHGAAYSVWEAKSTLEWLCQCLQGTDDIQLASSSLFSSGEMWENQGKTKFPTNSTFFPQKERVWRAVFHIDAANSSSSQNVENSVEEDFLSLRDHRRARIQALLQGLPPVKEGAHYCPEADPIAPVLPLTHAPLKLGVTAFLRSLAGEPPLPHPFEAENPEPVGIKRLPLQLTRPRLLSDLPALPGYLREAEEPQTALLRGVATHKALSLLALEPLQKCLALAKEGTSSLEALLAKALREGLDCLLREGRITQEENDFTNAGMLVRFFSSSMGQRALQAGEIHREWSFNLRAPDLCESLLQGVIDLCFLEDGAWVLVDYKTDRVPHAEKLWETYGQQLSLYRRALTAATGLPVRESALFALALGEFASRSEQ